MLIRKGYRRTSFCVTLKGATYAYPQGCKAGFLFFFLHLFSSFSQIWGHSWCFLMEKSEIRTLFHVSDAQMPWNGSEKGGKEKNTGGRITVLLSLTSEPAIFPEPKDEDLRRWGFKDTSERLSPIALMDLAYSGFSFRDFFCIFLRILMG